MALYQWPEDWMPAPSTVFEADMVMPTYRTGMMNGKTRQRNRFNSELSFYNVLWQLTEFQRGLFKTIVKDSLNGGADFFNITLPVSSGMQSVVARIVESSYTETYISHNRWDISATLESEDVPTVSKVELDALLIQLESEGC